MLRTMLITADRVKRQIKQDDDKKKNDDRREDDDYKKDDDQEDGDGGKSMKTKVLLGTLKSMYDAGWQF